MENLLDNQRKELVHLLELTAYLNMMLKHRLMFPSTTQDLSLTYENYRLEVDKVMLRMDVLLTLMSTKKDRFADRGEMGL